MESSEFERIKRVVDAFERSDWTEIDVRVGELRIHLAVDTPDAPIPRADRTVGEEAAVEPRFVPRAATRPADAGDVRATTDGSQTSDHPTATTATVDSGHLLTSPTPGIFWRSPEPGAPPFADVGDTVDAADTVCIIEVMKLMNHLKAGVRGRVVAVHGENGVAVGKDAPLFTIVPDVGHETVS